MLTERSIGRLVASFLCLLIVMSFSGGASALIYAEDTSSSSSRSVPEGDKLIQLTPPSITSGGNSLTVRGRLVFYHPGSPVPEPIKRALVLVLDSELWPKPDEVVARGYTDYDGYFSFSGINNDDGWFQDGRDIYVEVYADNWAVDVVASRVLGFGNPTYHANNKADTREDVSDHSIIDFGTLSPEHPGAYNILNTVLTGWNFLQAQLGISVPRLKAHFRDDYTPERSYYYGGSLPDPLAIEGIHISSEYGDQWHEDVILHEYGHYIMDAYADFWPPLSDLSHASTALSDFAPLETAFVEGWAHFFSATARDWAGYSTPEIGNNFNIEDNHGGSGVEAAVAGILWDIYDAYDGSEPQDVLELGFDKIWDVLVNYDPESDTDDFTIKWLTNPTIVEGFWDWIAPESWQVIGCEGQWPIGKDHPWNIYDFWDGFFDRNPGLGSYYISGMWRIFDLHGVRIPDNVSPHNPTSYSSSHTLGVPSWGDEIRIVVDGAYDDLSGVDGYSVIWDNSPFTLPPETINYPGAVIISPILSEGLEWYFHLRTVDYAGNWATDTFHGGPFLIKIETVDDDTTGPTISNPGSYLEVTHVWHYTWAVITLSIDVTDPSGISEVLFNFHGERRPFIGFSGDTYWTHFYYVGVSPPSWGDTIRWYVLALDDDNEGLRDRAWALSPQYSTQLEGLPPGFGISLGVDISIEPSSSVVEVGGFTKYKILISNIGNIPDTYNLTLQGLDPSWSFSFSTDQVSVDAGQTESVTLTVSPPYASMILGDYGFTVAATSLADPSVFDTADAVISVKGPILKITADSPVNILVTAPNGLRVGYDPETGTTISEIPGAMYSGPGSEPQVVRIPNSLVGHYLIDTFGTATGTYTMTMEFLTSEGSTIDTITWTGTSEPGEHDAEIVAVGPDGTIADITPPTTEITLTGTPGLNDWYTSDADVTLTATDHLSGVALTQYSLEGATWITYTGQFTINAQGTTTIYYNSIDNAGNVEETKSAVMKIDTTLPTVNIDNPPVGYALQDGVTFIVSATDTVSGISSVKLSIRDASGNPIGFEEVSPTFDPLNNLWSFGFDTLQLPDGYYTATATATDSAGNIASTTVPYSIRNWAVIELLPASETNKAGRTMPVKFALRVAASVDPNEPFVYNEDLTIETYATEDPSNILQTSTFGDTARDYRINTVSELYITNFKTSKTPMQYTVTIYRDTFLISSFEFSTTR